MVYARYSPFAVISATLVLCATSFGQPLRYELREGKKFSYEVEIQVDAAEEKSSYKGFIHYTVDRKSGEQSSITYRGGLNESKTYTRPPDRGAQGGFPPSFPGGFPGSFPGGFPGRIPGPPSFSSPFSRPTFAGKSQTTNQLTITSRGETLAMTGDSQLPYLLGNVSLLPFELLPKANEKQWSSDSGISITKESNNQRGRFGPFGPSSPISQQSGGEVTKYSIAKMEGDLVSVNKTYRLFTPPTDGKNSFEMKGTGTWTFDRTEGIPKNCEMKLNLVVKSSNTTTSIPISLKYKFVSAFKIAAMEEEAKKKAEEAAKKKAEEQAIAEKPLDAEEKMLVLAALRSDETVRVLDVLKILATKSPKDPDQEIIAAIKDHLGHSSKQIANAAHTALSKWSPSYATKSSLAKEYQGPGPVKSTELIVESITPLFVGQIVQAQKDHGSFWYAGRIKALMPDGTAKIAFLHWGKEYDHDTKTVQRRKIQLAPAELDQPDRPSSFDANRPKPTLTPSQPLSTQARTWSDLTGNFKVEAEFMNMRDGMVSLKRADGRTMSIPFDKLSEKDQEHVQHLLEAENPFQLN